MCGRFVQLPVVGFARKKPVHSRPLASLRCHRVLIEHVRLVVAHVAQRNSWCMVRPSGSSPVRILRPRV